MTPSAEVLSAMQLQNINEPLFPNLISLTLLRIQESSIPFILLFLSPRTIFLYIGFESIPAGAVIASMITTLPTRCPNLRRVTFRSLPRDAMTTTSISGMLLATNRKTLQRWRVNCPLTEEANDVLYRLPNLRDLSVQIERGTSSPSASLPNLTKLSVVCDNEKSSWPGLFRRAIFGKLESVSFCIRSESIGNFLGAFEKAALSSFVQNTLSELHLFPLCPLNSNYSSLLAFTRLEILKVSSCCNGRCSSTVDDNMIIHLSRAMSKLKVLELGGVTCRQSAGGVTTKGLMALARNCPNLSILRVHLQVASLEALPASPEAAPDIETTAPCVDCALTGLEAGKIPLPEGSVSLVAQTLLRIFPRIEFIEGVGEMWDKVGKEISRSRQTFGCTGRQYTPITP